MFDVAAVVGGSYINSMTLSSVKRGHSVGRRAGLFNVVVVVVVVGGSYRNSMTVSSVRRGHRVGRRAGHSSFDTVVVVVVVGSS